MRTQGSYPNRPFGKRGYSLAAFGYVHIVLLLQDVRAPVTIGTAHCGVAAGMWVVGSQAVQPRWSWAEVVSIHPARAIVIVGESDVADAGRADAFRAVVRSVARVDLPPWLALRTLEDATAEILAGPLTMTYAVLDAIAGEASIAQAGALPPVAFAPGQQPQVVSVPVTAPLGLGRRIFDDVTCGVPWRAGLVVRTAASLGSASAVAGGLSVRQRSGDPGELADRMVEAATRITANRPPGALMCVLARRGGPSDVVRKRMPVLAQAPRITRRTLARAARHWPVDHSSLSWIAAECVGNVVRHCADARTLEVRCARLADGALLEVVDPNAAPPQHRMSSWLDDSGRGLEVLSGLALDWGFRWAREGKVVWAHVPGPS